MKLSTIKRRLNGSAPRLFIKLRGQRIGSGSQRTAYRIGDYVVKANTCAWNLSEFPAPLRNKCKRVPRKALHRMGLRAPACWYAGKNREWVIMPYYPPVKHHAGLLRTYEVEIGVDLVYSDVSNWEVAPGLVINLDVCARNSGVNKKGEFVAFDW